MVYYALLEEEKDGSISVSFPDLPGCYSCAYADSKDPLNEALSNAKEALNGYLSLAVDAPKPQIYNAKGYHPIEVEDGNIVLLNIRWLRKQQALTQAQVAARLNISQEVYQRIESGHHGLHLNTLIDIVHIYNKSLKDVVS